MNVAGIRFCAGHHEKVSVYRERPATPEERKADPEAKIMAEWVHITFGDAEPETTISRNLCDE